MGANATRQERKGGEAAHGSPRLGDATAREAAADLKPAAPRRGHKATPFVRHRRAETADSEKEDATDPSPEGPATGARAAMLGGDAAEAATRGHVILSSTAAGVPVQARLAATASQPCLTARGAPEPGYAQPRAPRLRRSNSTSSIFVNYTISAPNDVLTLKCVALVLHRMVMQGAMMNAAQPAIEKAFHPRPRQLQALGKEAFRSCSSQDVFSFLHNLFINAQLSHECNIIGLAYVDRMINYAKLYLTPSNWRQVLFGAWMLASKVFDDLSMVNRDFSVVCPMFSNRDVNEVEVAVLTILDYNVAVNGEQYALYYFRLHDELSQVEGSALPQKLLDIKDAARLEYLPHHKIDDDLSDELKPVRLRRKVTCDESSMLPHPIVIN